MNMRKPANPSSPQENAIGDQNVERLLSNAYQPESLDPEFVQRVHAHACAAAGEIRRGPTASPADSSDMWRKTSIGLAAGCTALAIVLVAGYFITVKAPKTTYYPEGEMVWIDGQPYVPARPAASVGGRDPILTPVQVGDGVADLDDNRQLWIGEQGLTPRLRLEGTPPEMASVGDSLTTKRGERRRVELPDESILYLNENATVSVNEDRRITVETGEIFVEVSSAEANGGTRFVVATPDRDVTALGTKFAVNVNADGTDVAVTQGKVEIAGVEQMLLAGQQIRGADISPLPRTSHVLHWTRELMAAAESPLVPASEYGGGALVAVDPGGQEMKLSLRKYSIDVHIEDGFARTTIDQTYFNHQPGRLEGTFYFPLPPDASISRLAMYVNGRLMEGGMAEREHARNVFETIKYRSLDPALLEWVDGSTFKMRVFPLEGRQEKRIVLSYTQRLGNHYGRMQYRFPAGHNMNVIRDWSVKLHVDGGAAVQWACHSHELKADSREGNLTLTTSGHMVKPDRDVVVSLIDEGATIDEASERARFSTVEHDGLQYLMLRFRPQLEAAERRQRRDWVFLLEADGSRDPLLARAQVDIVKTLLENAEHDDTFSIVTAGTRVHAFAASQQPVTPENIASAVEFLDKMHLIGALDLEKALTAASRFAQTAPSPVLVHVGAGIPILGERQTDKLLEAMTKEVLYVGVGVGKRWNRQFMKAAASRTGGYFTQINPDEPVNWRAFELGSALNTPHLMDIHVEPDDGQGDFMAVKDWVAHGEEFCAVMRLMPGGTVAESVTVSGSVNGESYLRTIPVENVEEEAAYLPRTWAKLAIDDMVARNAEKNKSRVIELSKAMYVMSPFTSLLVLENDEMYEQYNVDRGRKDHWALYPCPERIDVVREPLQGPRPEVSADPHDTPTKPSLEEVLQSLLVQPDSSGNLTMANTNWMPHVVHVPDGGTMLLGGIKRHGDINGNGAPLLDKLPYVNRLFRNGHFFDEPDDVMLMLTPRIIIQEEEEALLGFGDLSFADGRRWDVDNDGDGAMTEFHSLIQLIDSTVSPDTWEAVGGSGSINAFPSNLSLAISQTQRIHDPIPVGFQNLGTVVYPVGDLVIPITQAHQGDFGAMSVFTDGTSNTHLWNELSRRRSRYESADLAGTVGASEQRIWKRLDKKAEFKYHQQRLKDVIADLRQRYDIPMVINHKAIEEYGIATDSPITMNVSGISLRSGLRLILVQFNLTYFVADDVLQITAPEDRENQLVSRNYGFDEMLLLLRRSNSNSSREHGSALDDPRRVDPRRVDRRAHILNQRMSQEATQPSLLYPQPGTVAKRRSFRRLVAFAPATTTTKADALAVLEAEASLKNRPEPGRVDEAARKLIEAARGWGWQVFTLRGPDNRVVLEVTMDGLGRFRFDHLTEHGLRETVVCNGETLRHLYPELGLGTTRSMSRFHRAGLTRLVPWLLPTVDDLALGADLRLIGPRTVAIAPHGVGLQDEDGQPQRHVRLHLEFSADGRLAERRVVEMPSAKTIVRVAYSEEGTVRWFDGDNKQRGELHISIGKADTPNLTPDVDSLVVLPMPVRNRGHVYKVAKVEGTDSSTSSEKPDALRTIASDEQNRATDPAHWNEEDALRLLAANHLQNAAELRDVIGRRFFARGDRRIGFYTLLLSSGERWDADGRVKLSDGTTTRMSPLSDHPKSTLARYIDCQLRKMRFDLQDARYSSEEMQRGFILQLVEYQQLAARWSLPNGPPEDAETRRRELDQLFDFLSRCDSPRFAFVLLRRLQQRYGNSQPHGRIAEALIELEKHGTTSYAVKYELARSLASRGEKDKARSLFIELFRETLDEGILPPIDKSFATAMQGVEDPFGADDNGENGFSGLMRGACTQLIDRKQRRLAIALAWQCRQLDEVSLGDILINQVLTGVPDDEQLGTTLGALEYLVSAGQHDRADALLKSLLSSQLYADSPALWRLAAVVASDGGRLARSISHLERAMDLEYENLPKRYNVEQVRQHYGELFASYHELAQIVAQSKSDVPVGLVARAIKAADRWRSLDTDVTAACNDAASVLSELGMDNLAWDYLTTPLAMKPNEATAWLNLAQTLRNDGDFELADRAYATAFEAEPTNAQILWDHAQLLEQTGRSKKARTIYRRIANGQWQPRFNPIKRRAERIKSRDSD